MKQKQKPGKSFWDIKKGDFILDKNMKTHENDPFVLRKLEEANKVLRRMKSLPK